MNDPDFNLLAALDPLPVSTEVITVSQARHPRLEQAPATAGCGSGCVSRVKKSPHKCGQKYWKQCEQCRTEYLSYLLNYSVMRKIIFLI
ncbi:TPA: hypothetical protein MFB09_003150 [Klebsiella pneumoniae]|nr:hypothetical protein [Klebsiella pneumoniae]HBW4753926.1 hypothetical protein [Klebsiella pneumoniae]HBW6828598.1 hypothetical protein [Klebsiella pneumoniae]